MNVLHLNKNRNRWLFLLLTLVLCSKAQISDALFNRCTENNRPRNRHALTMAEKRTFVSYAQDFIWLNDTAGVTDEIQSFAKELEMKARTGSDRAESILNYSALGDYHLYFKGRESPVGSWVPYYIKVIQLAGKDPQFAEYVGYAYNGVAAYRVIQSRYEEAAKLLTKALQTFSSAHDTTGMAGTYGFMSQMYTNLMLFPQSIECDRQMMKLTMRTTPGKENLDRLMQEANSALAMSYLGWYEREGGKALLDSADICIKRSSHFNSRRTEQGRASYYFSLGYRAFLVKDYQYALVMIDSSLNTEEYYPELTPTKRLYKGLCLLKLGKKQEAKKLLAEAGTAKAEHSLKQAAFEALCGVAVEENNLQAAFDYREKAYKYKDSAALILQRGKVFEVTQKYSLMEKEVEIKNLEIANAKKEQQRKTVIWVFAITTVSMLLIIIGLYTISRSRKIKALQTAALLEKEKRNKEDIIRLQERDLQRTRKRVIFSLRKKISRDLHDELSSSLAGLRYYVNDLRLKEGDQETKSLLLNVEQEVESVYKQARNYMHNLSAGIEEAVGKLAPFLQSISKDLSQKNKIDIRLKYNRAEIESRLNSIQQNQLTLILKEATTNILKHSGATVVEIAISFTSDTCFFSVSDNGHGFSEDALHKGLGMESMEIRIRRIRGRLQTSTSAHGTIIEGYFSL